MVFVLVGWIRGLRVVGWIFSAVLFNTSCPRVIVNAPDRGISTG